MLVFSDIVFYFFFLKQTKKKKDFFQTSGVYPEFFWMVFVASLSRKLKVFSNLLIKFHSHSHLCKNTIKPSESKLFSSLTISVSGGGKNCHREVSG